jgi:alanine racemase
MPNTFFESQPTTKKIQERIDGFSSWFEIDLDILEHNLNQIKTRTSSKLIPCVKNNAYGHGLVPIVSHLEALGIERVLVAKFGEALELREAGIGLDIVNMAPLFSSGSFEALVEKGIIHVVYTEDTAQTLSDVASRNGMIAHVFMKIDTGLRRVGVKHDHAANFLELVSGLPGLEIEGIFSTLGQNDELDSIQAKRLLEVEEEARRRGIDLRLRSLASSDAVLYRPEAHLDAVRPGMLLYGVYPTSKDRSSGIELKQALSFKARLEHAKWVEKGESITYWGRFIAPKRMRIGTLHVGFYDALPRELSNRGRVRIGDEFRSILGSVSLNHILVDLTDTVIERGDVVEVIGRKGENTVNAIADIAGWMTYSLLNHLNPFTPRIYLKKGKPVALLESSH